jgi:hypothetical protein
MRELLTLFGIIAWLMGIYLAKGWLFLIAVIFPIYAWYEVLVYFIQKYHLL